jgi:hypothetical protein
MRNIGKQKIYFYKKKGEGLLNIRKNKINVRFYNIGGGSICKYMIKDSYYEQCS